VGRGIGMDDGTRGEDQEGGTGGRRESGGVRVGVARLSRRETSGM
jgi:hypothetical protein